MKNLIILSILLFASSLAMKAQDLLAGTDMFSHKKTAYITKKDGSEVTGTVDKIKRKKGLLKSVAMKTDAGKVQLAPDEIDFMYLAPSGLNKLTSAMDKIYTMSEWDREDVDSDLIKKGYVYFERANVKIKGNQKMMLMQLLNPGFSSKVRVYFDPFAKETMSGGIGGVTVAGGLDKSYYILRGDGPAYRMRKKDYKKDFKNFYSDCPDLLTEYGKPYWPDFAKHVYQYSEDCK